MVSEPTPAVSRARGAHVWCRPGVVTQHGTCAGTGHMDVAKTWPREDVPGLELIDRGVDLS